MHTFFHGWRRKWGCVLLLLACVAAGMWMRSLVYGDFLLVNRGVGSNDFLCSFQSGIKWVRSIEPPAPEHQDNGLISWSLDPQPVLSPRYAFSLTGRYDTDETLMPVFGGDIIVWRSYWQGAGFRFGDGFVSGYQVTVYLIPYWFVTVLLTLLSAYLILWTPGKTASSTSGEQGKTQ